jgi:hypothetical protein
VEWGLALAIPRMWLRLLGILPGSRRLKGTHSNSQAEVRNGRASKSFGGCALHRGHHASERRRQYWRVCALFHS